MEAHARGAGPASAAAQGRSFAAAIAPVLAIAEDGEIAGRLASLSPQQMRILMMIVGGELNKQFAGELGIAEQTVKVHVSTILRKLEVRSRTQATVLVQATYGGLPERS